MNPGNINGIPEIGVGAGTSSHTSEKHTAMCYFINIVIFLTINH